MNIPREGGKKTWYKMPLESLFYFHSAWVALYCSKILLSDFRTNLFQSFCKMNAIRSISRAFSRSATVRIGIPFVVDNDGKTERVYDIYSRLLKDRIICVMNSIDDHFASAVIAQLLFLQSESGKTAINMYINCPGGSVTDGLGIYDTMQHISAPVATWCIGQASSMGSLLLAAGAKGMRTSLPNARIMVHQPSGGAHGTAADIVIRAEEINRLRRRLNEIYSMHTGQTVEAIDQALDRDRYMSALEAKEFGLVDRVEAHSGSVPNT